jgi:hypothetical protein
VWGCCAVRICDGITTACRNRADGSCDGSCDGTDILVACHASGKCSLWSALDMVWQVNINELHFSDHMSCFCAPQADRLVLSSSSGVRIFRFNVHTPEEDENEEKRFLGGRSKSLSGAHARASRKHLGRSRSRHISGALKSDRLAGTASRKTIGNSKSSLEMVRRAGRAAILRRRPAPPSCAATVRPYTDSPYRRERGEEA